MCYLSLAKSVGKNLRSYPSLLPRVPFIPRLIIPFFVPFVTFCKKPLPRSKILTSEPATSRFRLSGFASFAYFAVQHPAGPLRFRFHVSRFRSFRGQIPSPLPFPPVKSLSF